MREAAAARSQQFPGRRRREVQIRYEGLETSRLKKEAMGTRDRGEELSVTRGLTQASLAHICSAHVFTDELGLSTKLLED